MGKLSEGEMMIGGTGKKTKEGRRNERRDGRK